MAPYNGQPYYCTTTYTLPTAVYNGASYTFLNYNSPCTVPGYTITTSDPVCGQATTAICEELYSGYPQWGYQWYAYAPQWYNGYPIAGTTCFAQNYYSAYSAIPITNGRYSATSQPQICQYGLTYSTYPNMQVYRYSSTCP